jgi:hypothetical protein
MIMTALQSTRRSEKTNSDRPQTGNRFGAIVPIITCMILISGCPNHDLVPLVGEDPEVAKLLGTATPDTPKASAMAAARRLYLSLAQKDAQMVWALLAQPTRKLLNERAALIGVSGQELLEAGSLPQKDGIVLKVRFVDVFFGANIKNLKQKAVGPDMGPDQRVLFAVSAKGRVTQLIFLREDGGWRLLRTKL